MAKKTPKPKPKPAPKYAKMPKAIKTRWVKALRSGKYKQTTGQLRECDDDGKPVGYCCLGVLCDITQKESGLRWDDGFNDSDGSLPDSIEKLTGLHGAIYTPSDESVCSILAQANDGELGNRRWGFKRISNWIEKYL